MSISLPSFKLSRHAQKQAVDRGVSLRAIGLALGFGFAEPDGRVVGGRRHLVDDYAVRRAPAAVRQELARCVSLVVVVVQGWFVVTVFWEGGP